MQERYSDHASSESPGLGGVGILGSKTEGRAVLLVHHVDVLVQWAVVEGLVRNAVEGILEDEERDLHRDGPPRGHRDSASGHAAGFDERMEEPDVRELDGEIREEHEFGASPLLLSRRNLRVAASIG